MLERIQQYVIFNQSSPSFMDLNYQSSNINLRSSRLLHRKKNLQKKMKQYLYQNDHNRFTKMRFELNMLSHGFLISIFLRDPFVNIFSNVNQISSFVDKNIFNMFFHEDTLVSFCMDDQNSYNGGGILHIKSDHGYFVKDIYLTKNLSYQKILRNINAQKEFYMRQDIDSFKRGLVECTLSELLTEPNLILSFSTLMRYIIANIPCHFFLNRFLINTVRNK